MPKLDPTALDHLKAGRPVERAGPPPTALYRRELVDPDADAAIIAAGLRVPSRVQAHDEPCAFPGTCDVHGPGSTDG